MQDVQQVRAAMLDPGNFWNSPLYRALADHVATRPALLELAAHARPGQVASFAFLGAVHRLLLDGVDDPLGAYYLSVVGAAARTPDAGVGPALEEFARRHETEIRQQLQTRLVQTNHVQRAVGLRFGLHEVAQSLRERGIGGQPVHLLEVGCSAGLVMRQQHYGYRVGGAVFGDAGSAVQLRAEWRGDGPVPDLDDVPELASVSGVDLNPLDPARADDRAWLEALVWPENRGQADQLRRALEIAARTPLPVTAGDAVDRCPAWGRTLPSGAPRVVFHCATRMHVPEDRVEAFDRAILDLGVDGPLWRVAVEDEWLTITDPDGAVRTPFEVEGHLAWARPAGEDAQG